MRLFAKRRRKAANVAPKVLPGRVARGSSSLEEQAKRAAEQALRGTLMPGVLSAAPAAYLDLPDSPGEALPNDVRRPAEAAFAADLGAVRVHRDPVAASAAAHEGAHAFTAGRDIYFGESEWRPTTDAGRALIYHELAHVLQQTPRVEIDPQASPRRGGRNG